MTDPRDVTMAALVDALIGLGKVSRALSTLAIKAVAADKPKEVEIDVKEDEVPK